MIAEFYKMASAEFLEQALSTDVDQNAVNAIVGSLENQLVTSVSSTSSQNIILNGHLNQISNITTGGKVISVQKYNPELSSASGILTGIQSPTIVYSSASFNNVQSSIPTSFISQALTAAVSNSNEHINVYSQTQGLNPNNRVTFPAQTLTNGCIGLSPAPNQILHTVTGSTVLPQSINKTVAMQPPLVIKQGANSGQVGMQTSMVTVPMSVNSSMSGSIPNVMTINKPGGQNVVVTTQNLGSGQPTIIPNVQLLNMRPGAPAVAAQKSVATVSPRVVIGAPQVVGTRAAAPGITLQTLQSLQPGQQGHLLLKTESGQYQLLRVGPAPTASTLTAPQAQTIRLSTVPAHPGVQTVSTSMAAAPVQIPGTMPPGPMAAPVVLPPPASVSSPILSPQPPTVTTQKPNDNTKEKCRNFLANLLDLSSKEPKSVEMNVRNLIQELIDAQVEPEEFCDTLEKLLNASPQPCLIGFLKRSLPLLRQSLVTKELIIEGINPPSPHVAFTAMPSVPTAQPVLGPTNMQMLYDDDDDEERVSPVLTPLLPPGLPMPLTAPLMRSPQPLTAVSVSNNIQLYDDEDDENRASPVLTPLLPTVLPLSAPLMQNQQMSAVSLARNIQLYVDDDDDDRASPVLTTHMGREHQIPLSTALMHPYQPLEAVSMPNSFQLRDEDSSSPTLTPLLPPVLPVTLAPPLAVSPNPINVMSVQSPTPIQQKPPVKPQNTIAVLQNIPVHTKINLNKVSSGKSMSSNNKVYFNRSSSSSAALSTVLTPGKSSYKDKEKKSLSHYSQPFGDDKMAGDDDINDVAAMGGVNLAEESQRILGSTELIGTQIRSCKDEYLVPMSTMQVKLRAMAANHGLDEPSIEVSGLLSHAVHERLKNLIEKLAVIAQHRIDLVKTDSRYEMTQDVKGQLKFLEELDKADKKRREDSEREMLMRAAKSRSKNEDPEQAKLKAKAKELQRAELEELRQREANLTALLAIGPRKKPRLEGPASGDSVSNGANTHNSNNYVGRSQMALRTRLKRINLRDMLYLLEQERETAHSTLLFKSYLK